MIDRLLAADLITRHKNPKDCRGDIVALTPKGEAILREIRSVWADVDKIIVAVLGREKADQLTALTREFNTALAGGPGKGKPCGDLEALLEELQHKTSSVGAGERRNP